MPNLKKWIINAANGAPIEAVVIGNMGWGDDYRSEHIPQYDSQKRNQVLSWDEAAPMIDYEFDSGFGVPECNAIYAWTKDKVIFIFQYDGSTGIWDIPRNPVDCVPEMPGG